MQVKSLLAHVNIAKVLLGHLRQARRPLPASLRYARHSVAAPGLEVPGPSILSDLASNGRAPSGTCGCLAPAEPAGGRGPQSGTFSHPGHFAEARQGNHARGEETTRWGR